MTTSSKHFHPEFDELERVASGYLTAPHSVPKTDDIRRWRFRLRLWHYPSFSPNRAWGLYQLHERGSRQVRSLVRQVTWDRPSDAERLTSPLAGVEKGFHTQPTIEVRDRPTSSSEFEARIEELTSISFPPFASTGINLDGEVFGIAFPKYAARVEWWGDGPESWKEIADWHIRMREWLTLVTEASPRMEHWAVPQPKLP